MAKRQKERQHNGQKTEGKTIVILEIYPINKILTR
jgi:hypothetical protein